MKKVLPARKYITAQEIYNVRVRANMLMRELKKKVQSLDEVDFKPDLSDKLFKPIDEVVEDINDPVTESARDVYYSYLNDKKCSFKLFQYFDDLSMNQRSFMNHGLCLKDHTVLMRLTAGSELKMLNSKKSEKLDSENRVLIISY